MGKTVWFEYLYYPGYWLSKGYSYMYAALWKPSYHNDLFCLDEGYGWSIHKSEDGHSVLLETTRPGYKDYYFIGIQYYWSGGRGSSRLETNLVYMDKYKEINNEAFSFRILCRSCSSSNNCIVLRAYDEAKLYANHGSELRMCNDCGSANWFDWRAYSPTNNTLKCSSSSGLTNPQSMFMISITALLTIKFFDSQSAPIPTRHSLSKYGQILLKPFPIYLQTHSFLIFEVAIKMTNDLEYHCMRGEQNFML